MVSLTEWLSHHRTVVSPDILFHHMVLNLISSLDNVTGRWTREEHLNFIKGLELHGKGWKKIAALIKTRTVVQIRTHAQKYFLKLQKARNESNGKAQSEAKLKDVVKKVSSCHPYGGDVSSS